MIKFPFPYLGRSPSSHFCQTTEELTCAESESFVSGGPSLTVFFFFFILMSGGRIEILLLAGHRRPASETPFKWRFAGVPMMAQH